MHMGMLIYKNVLIFAVLDGLKYADSHEWVKVDGSVATIGITHHAQVNQILYLYFIYSMLNYFPFSYDLKVLSYATEILNL